MEIRIIDHCDECDEDVESNEIDYIVENGSGIKIGFTHSKCGRKWESTYEFWEREEINA